MSTDASLFNNLKKYREHIFRSHAQYILKTYLEDWIKKIDVHPPAKSISYTAIIIEDRPSELLKFSIYNTLLMSGLRVKVVLFTTHASFMQMQELFGNLKQWLTVIELDFIDQDINKINRINYNNILKSSIFWEFLPTRNILIFQTDALLIEPLDFKIFNYDYVGAPFANNKYLSTSFPHIIESSVYEKVAQQKDKEIEEQNQSKNQENPE